MPARPVGGQRVGAARRARDHAHRDAAEAFADLVELGVDETAVAEVAAAAHQDAGLDSRRRGAGFGGGLDVPSDGRVVHAAGVGLVRACLVGQAERFGPAGGAVDLAELACAIEADEHRR